MYKLLILATISIAKIDAVKLMAHDKEQFECACNGQFNNAFSNNLPKKNIKMFYFISNDKIEDNIRQLEQKNFTFAVLNFADKDLREIKQPEETLTASNQLVCDHEVFSLIETEKNIKKENRSLILLFMHFDVVLENKKIISKILYPNSETMQLQAQIDLMETQRIIMDKNITKIEVLVRNLQTRLNEYDQRV